MISGNLRYYDVDDERVARMIVWLARTQSDIKSMERGKVEINFAGYEDASVKPSVTRHYDA